MTRPSGVDPCQPHNGGVPELDPAVLAFYCDRYDEDQRLVSSPHGRLEFLRMQQLLRRYLPPPPAAILDVGGGTGIHARWLAQEGYESACSTRSQTMS